MDKNHKTILEIALCIEKQFYPDTRLILTVCGMISMHGEKPGYFRWIDKLYNESIGFCIKEGLI